MKKHEHQVVVRNPDGSIDNVYGPTEPTPDMIGRIFRQHRNAGKDVELRRREVGDWEVVERSNPAM